MAIPSYFHFGFFSADSIGDWKPLQVMPGPETDAFEACFERLLGGALRHDKLKRILYRDEHGIVTLAPWGMDGQRTLMHLLLELQRDSGCQIIYRCGARAFRYRPEWLEKRLRYHVEKYAEDVGARWGGWRGYSLPDELLQAKEILEAPVVKPTAGRRKRFVRRRADGPTE